VSLGVHRYSSSIRLVIGTLDSTDLFAYHGTLKLPTPAARGLCSCRFARMLNDNVRDNLLVSLQFNLARSEELHAALKQEGCVSLMTKVLGQAPQTDGAQHEVCEGGGAGVGASLLLMMSSTAGFISRMEIILTCQQQQQQWGSLRQGPGCRTDHNRYRTPCAGNSGPSLVAESSTQHSLLTLLHAGPPSAGVADPGPGGIR
jgi:hypothetical protein